MTRNELINKISKKSHLNQTQAKAALSAFLKVTSSALKRGDKIKLVDFGTFCVTKRSQRTCRHPKTGSVIIIAPRKVVRFKPGGILAKGFK